MKLRGAVAKRGGAVDDRGARGVAHGDGGGAVLSSRGRFGDDNGHGLTDVADAVGRERVPDGVSERRAVAAPNSAAALGDQRRDRADAARQEVAPREHVAYAVDRARRRAVDPEHVGVSVRRAHERGVRLPRRVQVVGEPPVPAQQPQILPPLDRGPDPEARHGPI